MIRFLNLFIEFLCHSNCFLCLHSSQYLWFFPVFSISLPQSWQRLYLPYIIRKTGVPPWKLVKSRASEFFNFVTFYFYISIHNKKNGRMCLNHSKINGFSVFKKLHTLIYFSFHYCIYNNIKNAYKWLKYKEKWDFLFSLIYFLFHYCIYNNKNNATLSL